MRLSFFFCFFELYFSHIFQNSSFLYLEMSHLYRIRISFTRTIWISFIFSFWFFDDISRRYSTRLSDFYRFRSLFFTKISHTSIVFFSFFCISRHANFSQLYRFWFVFSDFHIISRYWKFIAFVLTILNTSFCHQGEFWNSRWTKRIGT